MQAIDVNRRPESENSADSIVKAIMSVPLLPSAIVSLIKGLDRIGLLPGAIIDASPFHTSLFFTNMASLRTAPVFHHLYAFGTTGTFIALGMTPGERRSFTLNISTDERIASGSTLARAFRFLSHLITHPERLEVPPTEVVSDVR
jgi:hypothetical protein